jgi:quinol monooxygenase YgiN
MTHQETSQIAEATFIAIKARAGRGDMVASLLAGAAALVRKTEPQTLQWLGLQEGASDFAIVDFFRDEAGRAAHFGGQVAAALKGAAADTLEGGWESGVVANVKNSKVLAAVVTATDSGRAKLAVRIDLEAASGQEEKLAQFLTAGAGMVRETEPGTLLWYALRIDRTHFAIFDVFASEEGKAAHFGGKVAAALKASASELVQGGWEAGVLAHVRSYNVLSATY